jgi:hypothetical protein
MSIKEVLYSNFLMSSRKNIIEQVLIGLKYTAVKLKNGSLGVGYTWHESSKYAEQNICPKAGIQFRDFEDKNAELVLDLIHSSDPEDISLALALVNALNSDFALNLDEDKNNNSAMFKAIKVKQKSRVAMVGYFKPIEQLLKKFDVELFIHDQAHSLGSPEELYKRLASWTDSLILTSTTIIGGTFEEILTHCPKELPIALLGPSTPLVPEIFNMYDIRYLGGTVPVDTESTLKVIRQGGGTRDFQKYGKKVFVAQTG